MVFHEQNVQEFLEIFNSSKLKIRNFDGCHHLELMRDVMHGNVFYTLSQWESSEALENYRQSELFKSTWAKTKVLFSDKPMAFSLEKYLEVGIQGN